MLAKYLVNILKNLSQTNNNGIKNSIEFVEKLKEVEITEGDSIVSFDVVSLFTNVPIDPAIGTIKNKLQREKCLSNITNLNINTLTELLTICLKNTYFQYESTFYEQRSGLPMGSPLSPIVCDLYMEELERKAINTSKVKPKMYIRYVDDTFIIWPANTEPVEYFLDHMNNQEGSIQFTMEKENTNGLPFLDVLVKRKNDKLITEVYRKKTDSGLYLNYTSNHLQSTKEGIIKTLFTRAEKICTEKGDLDKELKYIKDTLKNNNFPNTTIKKIENKREKEANKTTEKPLTTAVYPYIRTLSEKIRRIGSKMNIRTTFTSKSTIKKELQHTKPRDKKHAEKNIIYSIPCNNCEQEYIGQTNRTLRDRVKEHKNYVKQNAANSEIAKHTHTLSHTMHWEGSKVIGKEDNYKRRNIQESIEMTRRQHTISQPTFNISPIWQPIIKNIKYPLKKQKEADRKKDTDLPQ